MADLYPDSTLTYEDEKQLRKVSWLWVLANNTKNWELMQSICAPTVRLLYTALSASLGDQIKTREEYIAQFGGRDLVGDERLQIHHLLGAVIFTNETEQAGDSGSAQGHWQIKTTHLRTLKSGRIAEWTLGAYVTHFYERVEGKWLFAGLRPHTVITEVGSMGDVMGDFE